MSKISKNFLKAIIKSSTSSQEEIRKARRKLKELKNFKRPKSSSLKKGRKISKYDSEVEPQPDAEKETTDH